MTADEIKKGRHLAAYWRATADHLERKAPLLMGQVAHELRLCASHLEQEFPELSPRPELVPEIGGKK